MKTIAFLNIKGGVGKTTSTLAFALLLSQEHHKRVLVLDCDKQANSTKSLGCYGARYTTASLLTEKELVATAAVQRSSFGVDVIGASWGLMKANQDVLLDVTRPQQYRLKKQLEVIRGNYDYCLIDCPPDINMAISVITTMRRSMWLYSPQGVQFNISKQRCIIIPLLKTITASLFTVWRMFPAMLSLRMRQILG